MKLEQRIVTGLFVLSVDPMIVLALSSFVSSDMTHLKKELDDLVVAIIEKFLEPEKNKLLPKPA